MTDDFLLDTCAIIWIALNQPMRPEAVAAMNRSFAAERGCGVADFGMGAGIAERQGTVADGALPMDIFGETITTPGVRIERFHQRSLSKRPSCRGDSIAIPPTAF